jgi:hypothetical protein
MPRLLDALAANAAYAFIAVGIVWLAVAVLADSALMLWPVIACVAGGIQLKLWPSGRLTWAWAISSAVMGFLLSAYQVYAWLGFLGGAFSSLATASMVGFLVLAIAHVFLFYAGTAKPKTAKSTSS